jgi:LPS export ABC transporter protein LptC
VSGTPRGLIAATLLTGLAAALWLHLLTLKAADTAGESARQPDLYIDLPYWQTFDDDGRPERELRAVRLEKWPADSRARLSEPQLVLIDRLRQRWQAAARVGWLDENRQLLQLEQQVRLTREPGNGGLVVTTEALQIGGRGGLIETDRAVVLNSGSWHFTATGLRAEPGRQRLQLLENVRGTHD